jgi:hypothetical protein
MQTHNARRSHASKIATLALAAAFVAAALTAMSVTPPAPVAVAPAGAGLLHHSLRTAEAQRGPSPFGYLEFDWDGAVPGFAPLSDDPTAPGR